MTLATNTMILCQLTEKSSFSFVYVCSSSDLWLQRKKVANHLRTRIGDVGPGRTIHALEPLRWKTQETWTNPSKQFFKGLWRLSWITMGILEMMKERKRKQSIYSFFMIQALCLILGPDFCTDIVIVETSDHARLQLQLSYNWHFDVSLTHHSSLTFKAIFIVVYSQRGIGLIRFPILLYNSSGGSKCWIAVQLVIG